LLRTTDYRILLQAEFHNKDSKKDHDPRSQLSDPGVVKEYVEIQMVGNAHSTEPTGLPVNGPT
jgi:hypothetical protein